MFEVEKKQAKWSYEKESLETAKSDYHEQVVKLEKKNESLVAQNEKLKDRNKNSRKFNKYGAGNSSILESNISSRFGTNKFLGVKEMDQDTYSNKSSRFGTFTKFIGDGTKENRKIGDEDDKILNLETTPEHSEKKSSSTATISPSDQD
jgi:hypothetical protein